MKIISALIIGGIFCCLSACDPEDTPKYVCQTVQVKEILSLNYRDAMILLSNGKQVDVNQATLKPGDNYNDCTGVK